MEKTINSTSMRAILQAVPFLIDFPVTHFWVDYDKEADVLYISFERPQQATDTKMTEEGILYRYRGKRLVGITVIDASIVRQSPGDTDKKERSE